MSEQVKDQAKEKSPAELKREYVDLAAKVSAAAKGLPAIKCRIEAEVARQMKSPEAEVNRLKELKLKAWLAYEPHYRKEEAARMERERVQNEKAEAEMMAGGTRIRI